MLVCFVRFILPCCWTNLLFPYSSTSLIICFFVSWIQVPGFVPFYPVRNYYYTLFFKVLASQIMECFPLTAWCLSLCPPCSPRRVPGVDYPLLAASWLLSDSLLELSSVGTRPFTIFRCGALVRVWDITELAKPINKLVYWHLGEITAFLGTVIIDYIVLILWFVL